MSEATQNMSNHTVTIDGREYNPLDLLDAIDRMTEVASCAISLINAVRFSRIECVEGKEAEMLYRLHYDHKRTQVFLKSADIVLESLRDIAAEATGHPKECIQV